MTPLTAHNRAVLEEPPGCTNCHITSCAGCSKTSFCSSMECSGCNPGGWPIRPPESCRCDLVSCAVCHPPPGEGPSADASCFYCPALATEWDDKGNGVCATCGYFAGLGWTREEIAGMAKQDLRPRLDARMKASDVVPRINYIEPDSFVTVEPNVLGPAATTARLCGEPGCFARVPQGVARCPEHGPVSGACQRCIVKAATKRDGAGYPCCEECG